MDRGMRGVMLMEDIIRLEDETYGKYFDADQYTYIEYNTLAFHAIHTDCNTSQYCKYYIILIMLLHRHIGDYPSYERR